MRKSLLYALSGIGLLTVVVLGAFSLFFGNVDAAHPREIIPLVESSSQKVALPPPMISSQILEVAPSEKVASASGMISNESETTAIIDTDYDVLKMVETLNKRFSRPVLEKAPGWVLIKAERYLPNSNVPLASGQLLPDTYVEEYWANLNQKKQPVEYLTRSIAEEGHLLRQNYGKNTQDVTDTISEEELEPLTLDYGSLASITRGLEYGSEIRGWNETQDGIEVYIVTITDYYDTPVQFAGQAEGSNSLQNRLTFDIKSGRLLSGEMIHQFSNGESVIAESITILDIQIMPPKMLPEEVKQALRIG